MTAAVVLAAGGGSRFTGQGHKLLEPFRGRPLAAWGIEAASAAGLPVIVVCGASDEVADLARSAGAETVVNERWHEGVATSLQAGIDGARGRGHRAVVVGLADQPMVPASAWAIVSTTTTTPVAVATYRGQRGHPVRLAREVWPLLPTTGDEGARRLMAERPDLVTAVACDGDPGDVDTREDLQAWS